MTWQVLVPLIAQYGVPWAYQFWQIVTSSAAPTEDQWQQLLALSQKSLADYVKEAGGSTPPPA